MELEFLDIEDIDKYWEDDIAPKFKRVVDKACHGEFSVDDLYQLAKGGHIHICLGIEDGKVSIAGAFELNPYPSGKIGANWLAMGGRNLNEFMMKCVPPFKRWCRENGISWIECYVSPGMERIHHRYGFKTVYRNLRIDTEKE